MLGLNALADIQVTSVKLDNAVIHLWLDNAVIHSWLETLCLQHIKLPFGLPVVQNQVKMLPGKPFFYASSSLLASLCQLKCDSCHRSRDAASMLGSALRRRSRVDCRCL